MLPLILIPVLWLIALIVCLSICAMAARGDAISARALDETPLPKRSLSAGGTVPSLRLLDAPARAREPASPRPLTGRAGR